MRTAFLHTLVNLMRQHKNIITLTADMGFSVFENMQTEFPDRFMNTGVTEQSSIGIATGLALSGHTVYFYAQAPFATMRCFEQIRLDVCYNNVNVKIVGTASGFSSNQLGVSHFALEDIALMRQLPNMVVLVPGDPYEAEELTRLSYETPGPIYIRLTKSGSPHIHKNRPKVQIGKSLRIQTGKDCSIFVCGSMLPVALAVSDALLDKNIHVSVISFHTVKPLDRELIIKEAKKTKTIFTIEEHSIIGGLGTAVAEVLSEMDFHTRLVRFGTPDSFTSIVGSQEYLLAYNGLSKENIVKNIIRHIKE